MIRYYILFENYEQGLALHEALDEAGVMNRIAPAPAAARGTLCCGMSLLVEEDAVERARDVIRTKNAVCHSIVPVENQLQPRRDRYC
ncbi:MAG: DUF3343 domain-containing protein [Oscillibacter sp.]|nr:DUF3343 domain-containing protein [Oscillibacter sp.]